MTLRTKLLATIGVLYLMALLSLGVYAIRSSRDVVGFPARPAVPAGCASWGLVWSNSAGSVPRFEGYDTKEEASAAAATERAQLKPGETISVECKFDRLASSARPAVPARTIYEREKITTGLIASTLAAAVAVGAVLIWTRPGVAAAGSGDEERSVTLAESRPVEATDSPSTAPVESSPDNRTSDHPGDNAAVERVAERLRQLKALHDDGILTDDEYETKRQDLADRL